MRDRPIIFSAPMVRALLDGRKTMTRRLLKPQPPEWATFCQQPDMLNSSGAWVPSGLWRWSEEETSPPRPLRQWPVDAEGYHYWMRLRFQPGDRLWVRENFARVGDNPDDIHACPDLRVHAYYAADAVCPGHLSWRPSIHMPRWASRLTLTVTAVKVERLQAISAGDAISEGIAYPPEGMTMDEAVEYGVDPRGEFRQLWGEIYGPGAWDANPFVVAISVTVERRNIDA